MAHAGSEWLHPALRQRHVRMIALGGIIGASLFIGSGAVIHTVGPAAVVSYALGGLLVVLVMCMLGEMATAAPSLGSFMGLVAVAGRLCEMGQLTSAASRSTGTPAMGSAQSCHAHVRMPYIAPGGAARESSSARQRFWDYARCRTGPEPPMTVVRGRSSVRRPRRRP